MSDELRPPQNDRLTKNQDWDKHNKRAEKAAQVFQEHIASENQPVKRPKRSSNKRRWPIILVVIVLLGGIGIAGYMFMKDGSKGDEKSPTVTDSTQNTSDGQATELGSSETKQYTAAQLGLSLKYPSSWTVDEADGEIIFRSPATKLPATKPGLKGRVEITIRGKGQPLPEFENGNATATRQSELLTYTSPSQNQRASTHLTFLAYAPETNGLEAMYITGDYGYQKDQAVPQVDITNVDPIISVTFLACSDDESCTSNSPTTLEPSAWDDQNFSSALKTILQSITVN